MKTENPPTTGLREIEAQMDALRSALFRFSESQGGEAQADQADPLRVPLMNSILAVQRTMDTFLSLATLRK